MLWTKPIESSAWLLHKLLIPCKLFRFYVKNVILFNNSKQCLMVNRL